MRTLHDALEARYKKKFDRGHEIPQWLIEHAFASLRRYFIGEACRMAYERSKGKTFSAAVAEMRDHITYLIHGSEGVD